MNEVMQHKGATTEGVILTPSAKTHVLSYLAKQVDSLGVRLSVKKTGCSGFSYVVDYVNAVNDNDLSFLLEGNYHLYIDKSSYPYLKGLIMDYVKQGLNAKFIFENPNQSGQCGCGESFTVN